jgi:hypothetical protein
MLLTAVQQVECVSGCGGGSGLPSNAEVIGVVAALASLAVAFYAIKISVGSLRIAEEQHEEFLRKLRARADFTVDIRSPGHKGVIETDAAQVEIQWVIDVTNTGEKPARHVGFAFSAPDFITDLKWVEGEEDSILSQKGGAHVVSTDVVAEDGLEYAAQAVTKIVDYIGRMRRHSRVSGVLSLKLGEEVRVPVRLKVMSDDLPDDVEYRETVKEVLVRRRERNQDLA